MIGFAESGPAGIRRFRIRLLVAMMAVVVVVTTASIYFAQRRADEDAQADLQGDPAICEDPDPHNGAGTAHSSNCSSATSKSSASRHRSGTRSGQERTPTFNFPLSDITVMFRPQP